MIIVLEKSVVLVLIKQAEINRPKIPVGVSYLALCLWRATNLERSVPFVRSRKTQQDGG